MELLTRTSAGPLRLCYNAAGVKSTAKRSRAQPKWLCARRRTQWKVRSENYQIQQTEVGSLRFSFRLPEMIFKSQVETHKRKKKKKDLMKSVKKEFQGSVMRL